MSQEKIEHDDLVYKAKEKEKTVSFIWILPVIILGILAWIAYESYMKKGTNIEIVFKSAEGLKEGVTALEYKGLQLGKVTKIDINDINSVKVNILVKSDAAKFVASKGSRFWIKKPTISLTKVSGLSTLISGNKIEFSPRFRTVEEFDKVEEQYIFEGLDTKPLDNFLDNGYYVSLIATNKDNVQIGTPLFYNTYQIGEIVSNEFEDEKVYLKAYIYDKFNYLVNQSSKFIMNEALKVKYGPAGLKIQLGSVYSAFVGGITVVTKDKAASKIQKDENYRLYSSKEELKEKVSFNIKFLNADGIDVETPIIYKGIKIGELTHVELTPYDISTKAFLYKKYRYLLSKNSKFYISKPQVNFDEVKNLGNIVKGNYVTLIYEKGEFTDSFESQGILDIKQTQGDIRYTLYSQNLGSISQNSKVYYKNIPIGKVENYSLTNDLKQVKINILIQSKYSRLINNHTLFYDMSSKLVELKGFDLDVNYPGIKPLLNGSIAILDVKRSDKKRNKKSFKLYTSYKDVEQLKRLHNTGSTIDAYFDNSFKVKKDMAVVYKNQEIGFVKQVVFNDKKSKAKLFIYSKYKSYINKNSAFYKKGVFDFKASLNGVIFEMDNFTSLLEGSIHLEKKSKKAYKTYKIYSSKDELKNSSNTVTILFDDVEGLHEEFSMLLYKGVKVGKVTSVYLNSKEQVVVKAQIFENFSSFAKKGTIFFLKKPKISLEEVSNVGSTVMAVNIGIIQSKSSTYSTSFKGYDKMPSVEKSQYGKIFKVISPYASSVNEGAPVYYKNVKIGKVNKIDLSSDASKVIMDCLIYDKYAKFIRKNSEFYDISGFSMKFSLFSESYVESNTFTSILKGGLVVVTPVLYERKATIKDRFILHKDLRKDWQEISPSIKPY